MSDFTLYVLQCNEDIAEAYKIEKIRNRSKALIKKYGDAWNSTIDKAIEYANKFNLTDEIEITNNGDIISSETGEVLASIGFYKGYIPCGGYDANEFTYFLNMINIETSK